MVLSKIGNFEIISLLGKQVRERVLQCSVWLKKSFKTMKMLIC